MNSFTFIETYQQIETTDNTMSYQGSKEQINIRPRVVQKYCEGEQFKTHLQVYILQNIETLSIFAQEIIKWIGNEVSCGVGMQRIDIILSINSQNRKVIPIELKSVVAYPNKIVQMQRYVDWIEHYYLPNRPSDIEPMIISREKRNKTSQEYKDIIDAFNNFNNRNNIFAIKYVEFSIDCIEQRITFNEIEY